ncbi:MAG: ester cyclase [Aeromicrobium sp.]
MNHDNEATTFSVAAWAAFWDSPSVEGIGDVLAPDIVGQWPGQETVTGRDAYVRAIGELLTMVPDLRAQVVESAHSGDVIFIQWRAGATGPDGPFELTGIDRIRVRDGKVVDNLIRFDTAELMAGLGAGAVV